jgi:excisionase family DNA binding protein
MKIALPRSLENVADDALLTFGEVHSYLRCGASTLRRYLATGQIPTRRVGRLVRVEAGDLRRWLEASTKRRRRGADTQC